VNDPGQELPGAASWLGRVVVRQVTRGRALGPGPTHTVFDPFSVNPIRRSLGAIAVSAAMLVAPMRWLGAEVGGLVLVGVGRLAAAVLMMSVPVLIIATVEELWRQVRRRVHPPIEELDLSPRVLRLLHRYGLDTIAAVEQVDEATLMLLPNFDARARREVMRAISLRQYAAQQRAWEEERERDARRRRAEWKTARLPVRLPRRFSDWTGRR